MERLDLPLTSVRPYWWLAVRLLVIIAYVFLTRLVTAHYLHLSDPHFWNLLVAPIVAPLAIGTMLLIRRIWIAAAQA